MSYSIDGIRDIDLGTANSVIVDSFKKFKEVKIDDVDINGLKSDEQKKAIIKAQTTANQCFYDAIMTNNLGELSKISDDKIKEMLSNDNLFTLKPAKDIKVSLIENIKKSRDEANEIVLSLNETYNKGKSKKIYPAPEDDLMLGNLKDYDQRNKKNDDEACIYEIEETKKELLYAKIDNEKQDGTAAKDYNTNKLIFEKEVLDKKFPILLKKLNSEYTKAYADNEKQFNKLEMPQEFLMKFYEPFKNSIPFLKEMYENDVYMPSKQLSQIMGILFNVIVKDKGLNKDVYTGFFENICNYDILDYADRFLIKEKEAKSKRVGEFNERKNNAELKDKENIETEIQEKYEKCVECVKNIANRMIEKIEISEEAKKSYTVKCNAFAKSSSASAPASTFCDAAFYLSDKLKTPIKYTKEKPITSTEELMPISEAYIEVLKEQLEKQLKDDIAALKEQLNEMGEKKEIERQLKNVKDNIIFNSTALEESETMECTTEKMKSMEEIEEEIDKYTKKLSKYEKEEKDLVKEELKHVKERIKYYSSKLEEMEEYDKKFDKYTKKLSEYEEEKEALERLKYVKERIKYYSSQLEEMEEYDKKFDKYTEKLSEYEEEEKALVSKLADISGNKRLEYVKERIEHYSSQLKENEKDMEEIKMRTKKLKNLEEEKEILASKLEEIEDLEEKIKAAEEKLDKIGKEDSSEKITVEELSKENSKKSSKTTNKRKTSYSSEEEKDSASKGGKK